MGASGGFDKQADKVMLKGPQGVELRSSTVQTLALGLHELATNAVKYGALSRPEGRLVVRWSLTERDDGERHLRVEWRESGVPVSQLPDGQPLRQGYGRELIERALPCRLSAETAYGLTPEGVHCTITLPISTGARSLRMPDRVSASEWRGRRILVVEDDYLLAVAALEGKHEGVWGVCNCRVERALC